MAAGRTYTPLATTNLTGVSTITWSNIPQTYTDLIIVISAIPNANAEEQYQFNSDTGTNYSWTRIYGDGTTAASSRTQNATYLRGIAGNPITQNNTIYQIMNYSNSTTYKTTISRGNIPGDIVSSYIGLWRSTAAINSIKITLSTGSYGSGSTATLYGIAAA